MIFMILLLLQLTTASEFYRQKRCQSNLDVIHKASAGSAIICALKCQNKNIFRNIFENGVCFCVTMDENNSGQIIEKINCDVYNEKMEEVDGVQTKRISGNLNGVLNTTVDTVKNDSTKLNICSQKTCYNGGSCQVVNSTSFECICSKKYTGVLCEIPLNLENLGSTNNPAFSCKQLVEKYPNTPTGLYWLNFTLPHVQVICEMTTSGGGWMKIGFVKVNESTVQAFSVVNDVKEDLMALYNVSTGTFLLGGESIAKLRSLLKFTQLRIKCYKSSVNRSFHIMTTEDALGDDVIRFVTGQSDSRPTACGSFVRLNDDDSILSQNCNKWGNNRWSATLLSDVTISSVPVKARLYTYVVTMVQLHHVNLLARDVVECDDVSTDSTGGVNVFRGEGIWEYFVR